MKQSSANDALRLLNPGWIAGYLPHGKIAVKDRKGWIKNLASSTQWRLTSQSMSE
jgi:hypothetical protein